MASNASTIRLRAGATAILVFAVAVISTALVLSSGIDLQEIERGAVDVILPIMTANPTVLAIVAWEVVLVSVLIAIFGIDLYQILADGRSGLLFAPVALIGGAGLFIVEVLMLLGISQGLAPAYAGATAAEQSAIEGTTQALLLFRSRMLLVAGVLWSLAAITFGREMLRSAEFPGWLGYWGYAAGVVGVIGGFFPLYVSLLVVRSLGQFLFILWVLIAGIILLRNR
jgi:hypothetical protein